MTIFEIDIEILRNLEAQRWLGCKKWTKNDRDLIPSAQSFILMVVFSKKKIIGGHFWAEMATYVSQI